ncbi:MAG: hypothetical protein ACJ8KU_10585 [Chthoniobacterales bacterium]
MNKMRVALSGALFLGALFFGGAVFRLGAANPTAGTISPGSAPVTWDGTAAGGTYNGESTCVDGVNCDTFTITVSGSPADWAGKKIDVTISWVVLANDYDLYIHKGDVNGPVVSSSTHGAPGTEEEGKIDPSTDGTGVFTVHVGYFTGQAADEYHGVAKVIPSDIPPLPAPPVSSNWTINYHGTCCEGNLAASGKTDYVLLPVLVTGNEIIKSDDGGKTWKQTYPPANASVPFGIEGDMQAFGDDVIFFGTELGDAVIARSTDRGETWSVNHTPVASAGNDQAWSYLGPLSGMRPGGALPLDKPYVLAGWFRIGSAVAFSFDGGLTFPIQTPLVGDDGSGSMHIVCHQNAHAPTHPGDTRVADPLFALHKAGHHGTWGTDRKFYWTDTADGDQPGTRDLYVCKTDDFGTTWSGVKHPVAGGPGAAFVVTHSGFDQKGTLYVLHGNKLYVSFNQGESMAFVHTLPRFGNALRSDAGADQWFVADNGTVHVGLIEDGGQGKGRIFYLRGSNVDTATPHWDEELVDVVDNVRLDFMQIVLNGNGIPTISYTTPDVSPAPSSPPPRQVTTASRNVPLPLTTSRARLLNISTRADVKTGNDIPIAGFIVTGSSPKKVLVRAIGPSLQVNGTPVAGRLDDPTLELYQQGNPSPIATNDNWKEHQADIEASGLPPKDDRESAIVMTLAPGAYTAVVRGKDNTTGIALAEAYDIGGEATSVVANLSTRGFVETGDNVMIGGFIAGPADLGPTTVVARGLGPSLKSQVPTAMDDPTLDVYDANGVILASNDDWQKSGDATEIQSLGLAPGDAAESVVLLPLVRPGGYTAILRGKNNTTGVGLVELYNIP